MWARYWAPAGSVSRGRSRVQDASGPAFVLGPTFDTTHTLSTICDDLSTRWRRFFYTVSGDALRIRYNVDGESTERLGLCSSPSRPRGPEHGAQEGNSQDARRHR